MSQPQLGVLVNLLAGRNRRRPAEVDALRRAAGPGARFFVTRNGDDLSGAITEMVRSRVSHLAVSGGDGSFQNLVTQWLNGSPEMPLPKIVPLLGGSMNMLSQDVGNGDHQVRTLERLRGHLGGTADPKNLEIVRRSTLRVEDSTAEHPLFGFVFTDGFVIRFLDHYYKGDKGPWPAFKNAAFFAWAAFSNAPEHRHFFERCKARLKINGIERTEYIFTSAATLEHVVFGFRMFHDGPAPGKHFSVVNYNVPWLPLAALDMPNIFYLASRTGRYLPGSNVLNAATPRFEMSGCEGYSLDGEMFTAKAPMDLTVTLGPTVEFVRVH